MKIVEHGIIILSKFIRNVFVEKIHKFVCCAENPKFKIMILSFEIRKFFGLFVKSEAFESQKITVNFTTLLELLRFLFTLVVQVDYLKKSVRRVLKLGDLDCYA